MSDQPADILFLFPPAHGNLGVFKSHLGVAYLRAALAREGISSHQYLNLHPGTVGEIAEDVVRHRSPLVGFTVYDANLSLSVALARAIKQRRPQVKVVFGGPSASFCAREILTRQPEVDACVMSEAEETGPGIVTWLLNGSGPQNAPPGLAIRRNGEVLLPEMPPLVGTQGPKRDPLAILDAAPSPYLSGVMADGRTGVLTGRGCTHHCQYCCFAALGRKKLRLHSIERVLAELEWIAAHQSRTGERYIVPIHDDAFTLLPHRAKSLCQAIIDRNLNLVLSCITRADAIDAELLQLMRQAGFVSLAFGLESAVPSVLRATGKVRPPDFRDPDLAPERDFVEQVRTSVVTAKKLGFNVGVSIILGLPTETAEDGAATLDFVKQLPIDFYMHNFLWVFPGTPLWDTHPRYGIGCEINLMGLATTTQYAYDLTKLRPRPKCSLEQDAHLVRLLALGSLHACAGPSEEGGISTAVLTSGELRQPAAAWLAEVLDVGGTLVQVYPPLTRRAEVERIQEDRCTFAEFMVPGRHHVQLLPRKGSNGCRRWSVASAGVDLYRRHKPQLVSIATDDGAAPYREWLRRKAAGCDICDVTRLLQRPHEILRTMNAAGDDTVGELLRRMPPAPAVAYPGRWLGSRAPCLALTRIEVDAEGNIRPCRQAEPIGTVGDDRATLAARLVARSQQAQRRRGCDRCPAAHCPQCPFPGLDDRTYCGIMRREGRALSFLNWAHLYSRLPMLLFMQRDQVGAD